MSLARHSELVLAPPMPSRPSMRAISRVPTWRWRCVAAGRPSSTLNTPRAAGRWCTSAPSQTPLSLRTCAPAPRQLRCRQVRRLRSCLRVPSPVPPKPPRPLMSYRKQHLRQRHRLRPPPLDASPRHCQQRQSMFRRRLQRSGMLFSVLLCTAPRKSTPPPIRNPQTTVQYGAPTGPVAQHRIRKPNDNMRAAAPATAGLGAASPRHHHHCHRYRCPRRRRDVRPW